MRKRANRVEPVFLFCVGATKAGTSWLYDQLRGHPDCHLRTIKEYHYFSNSNPAQWASLQEATTQEIARLSAEENPDNPAYIAERLSDLRDWSQVIQSGQVNLDQFRAYLLNGLGDRRVVGDFTPAYSVISAKGLSGMRDLGNYRIIYLIRDPLARLWSHIRMVAARNAPETFVQTAEKMLRRTLAGEQEGGIQGMLRRGDYKGNLPKLQRVFGADLLVMFTEDLMTKIGFDRVLAFLGLGQMQADFSKKVHEGRDLPFPAALRAKTLRFLRPQYTYIASEFSALPEVWRHNMSEAMA
jgi:hypothetical protein